MSRVLSFPLPPRSDLPDRDEIVGRRLLALRQTPWMAPVCIQDADGMRYECRVVLELESERRLELLFDRLAYRPGDEPLEQVRKGEHQWPDGIDVIGRTVAAVGRDAEGRMHVLMDNGARLSLGREGLGPLRVRAMNLEDSAAAKRELARLSDLWTGRPLAAEP